MHALVIAHEPDCTGGRVAERLGERGWSITTHVVTPDPDRPDEANPFPGLADVDLLVPMGSARSLTRPEEIAAWVHDEIELVRDAHHRGVPVLGICFGGQLIATALGGRVEVAPVTEIGWVAIDGEAIPDPVAAGPWFEWHHDRFVPPPDAEVLARSRDAIQLMRIGTTVGTQFHPEVDVDHLAGFLRTVEDHDLAAHGTDRATMLAEMSHHEARNIAQCHALVDWFLDEVVRSASPVSTSSSDR